MESCSLKLHCNNYNTYNDKPKIHLTRHDMSQHDTTCSTCRVHAFWLCRACTDQHARLDAIDTSNVSCRDTT